MDDYKAFLCAYISFLENQILFDTGKKSTELMYKFCNDIIYTLDNNDRKQVNRMVKVILFSIVLFFILDFVWYLFKKYICYEDYKNYIDYIKNCR